MFMFGLVASAQTVKSVKQELKEKIAQYIELASEERGVNPLLVLEIVRSESNFDPQAKNPRSSASGVMQYVNGTFKAYCIDKYELTDTMADKNNPIIQIDCAIEMLKEKNGWRHWETSSWDKSLATK